MPLTLGDLEVPIYFVIKEEHFIRIAWEKNEHRVTLARMLPLW